MISLAKTYAPDARRIWQEQWSAHRAGAHSGVATRHLEHCGAWGAGYDCMHLEGFEACYCAEPPARDSGWSEALWHRLWEVRPDLIPDEDWA